MSSSVVERTRALHADTEEMRERLLTLANKHANTAKDRILLDHELKHQLDELCACQAKLLELYEDADGVRASELRAMTGGGSTEQLWTNFYDTLSQIRMYHAKFPNAARIGAAASSAAATTGTNAAAAGKDAASSAEGEIAEQDSDSILLSGGRSVHFSAEESFGARVDMHALYERYINLPQFARTGGAAGQSGSAPPDYLSFLRDFPSLGRSVPREKKLKANPVEYRRFLTDLRDYLIDFHERTKPLVETAVLREMIREEFEQKWEHKQIEGWFGETNGAPAAVAAAAAAAAAEQEPGAAAAAAPSSSSAAAAPAASASSELYCSACSKQFAGQGVFTAHLSGKKHKKNAEIAAALSSSSSVTAPAEDANASAEGAPNAAAAPSLLKVSADLRSLALLEMEIASFAELLAPEISATREHLLKKQTRTYEELQAEIAATQAEVLRAKLALKSGGEGESDLDADADSPDPNAPLYNPLNLPLGFDGKPIPYWLYKLHGLNLKFDCEICGDYTYAGPRNFERHFTEWRHAYGMRALGIPNTKHFAHITKMADARALFEKLKREGVGAGFKPDEEEEMEDSEGNVFNKRTYLELQKQGLV